MISIKKTIAKSKDDIYNLANFIGKSAYVYESLGQDEEKVKAACHAKALGEGFAHQMMSIDPAYTLKLDSFPFTKSGAYGYKVQSTSEYGFAIKVNEKTTAKIAFEWIMSTANDMKGEVVMDSTALLQATKLFNYFVAGEKTKLSDMTSVWVSKKVYSSCQWN